MQSLSSDIYARYVLNFAPDYLDGMLKPAEKQRFLEVLQNDILHLTTEQSGELVEVFERLRKYYNRHDAVAEKLKQNYCLELLLCRSNYCSFDFYFFPLRFYSGISINSRIFSYFFLSYVPAFKYISFFLGRRNF